MTTSLDRNGNAEVIVGVPTGGLHDQPRTVPDTIIKAAPRYLIKQLALELSPIRANAIASEAVLTPLSSALGKDEAQVAAATPLSHIDERGAIYAAVAFLAADAPAWLNGETTGIDGGQRLGDRCQPVASSA